MDKNGRTDRPNHASNPDISAYFSDVYLSENIPVQSWKYKEVIFPSNIMHLKNNVSDLEQFFS